MDDRTRGNCERFIRNRDTLKSVFKWDSGPMNLACASILLAKERDADEEQLAGCRDLLTSSVGSYSDFRTAARTAIATQIAATDSPRDALIDGLTAYRALKERYYVSTFLPLVAMSIAQIGEPSFFPQIATRARAIFDYMKDAHPFLAGNEDSAPCALLALSSKSESELLADMRLTYQTLKPNFASGDNVQGLGHVLALCDGTPAQKCTRLLGLFNGLTASGYRYGTESELPVLGVVAMAADDVPTAIQEMVEIDDWLKAQKGFGLYGSITATKRLMYAAVIAMADLIGRGDVTRPVEDGDKDASLPTSVSSYSSLVVAQQMVTCGLAAACLPPAAPVKPQAAK